MVNHGTHVDIMANHDKWNVCQDHGKITMVRHVRCFYLYILFFPQNFLSSPISELAVVITSDMTFIYRKEFFKLKNIQ